MIEAVVNGLTDEFKWLRENRVKFLLGICVVEYLAAIPMVTGVSFCFILTSSLFQQKEDPYQLFTNI